jgi:hypothetical protein
MKEGDERRKTIKGGGWGKGCATICGLVLKRKKTIICEFCIILLSF